MGDGLLTKLVQAPGPSFPGIFSVPNILVPRGLRVDQARVNRMSTLENVDRPPLSALSNHAFSLVQKTNTVSLGN